MQRETDRTPADYLVSSIWGGPKTAKTWLAFTWPGEKWYFETDEGGFDRVRPHLTDEMWNLGINRETYALAEQGDKAEMSKLWNQFAKSYEPAMKAAGEATPKGTVILDTESILWPIIYGTWVDDPTGKKGALAWGPANSRYRRVIGIARKYRANLILIHQGTKVWEESEGDDGRKKVKETEELEPKAHKENLALVDIRIQTLKPWPGAGPTDFRARIEHSGREPKLEGMMFDPAGRSPVVRAGLLVKASPSYEEIAMQLGMPS